MDTGALVSMTVQDASDGDTATLPETLIMAAEQVEAVQPDGSGVEVRIPVKPITRSGGKPITCSGANRSPVGAKRRGTKS